MPPSSEGSDLTDRELYSIPASSSWFRWDEIHETERQALPEFFDGSAASRNPRVYKEYRDFVISKYREDPSKRLTFTEVRKSLIGDVGCLHKVFRCLEKWGLVNFGAKPAVAVQAPEGVGPNVLVEEGAPAGVQVVPACIPLRRRVGTGTTTPVGGENGLKLPPLTSYTDVFGDWTPKVGVVCGVCGEHSAAGGSESLEGGLAVCSKCSKDKCQVDGNTAENLEHETDEGTNHVTSAWTDAETLLLLEAVLKLGDDWDLIAQHVRTRSKLDCIARLIQLPFGEHILGSINGTLASSDLTSSQPTDAKRMQSITNELPQKSVKVDGYTQANEKDVLEEHIDEKPPKRRCLLSSVHAAGSLIKQVACLSTVAGPQAAAAAADAAVTALCSENPSARKAFCTNKDPENDLICTNNDPNSHLSSQNNEDQDLELDNETDTLERRSRKRIGATAFQVRTAIGTALGAAAARAKLLADQEEREMELLMASIIETQLRKITYKIKHFEELEFIMEKEYNLLEKTKESVLEEWVMVLDHLFKAGIPRWRDTPLPKPLFNNSTM